MAKVASNSANVKGPRRDAQRLAHRHAPFLRRLIGQRPAFVAQLLEEGPDACWSRLLRRLGQMKRYTGDTLERHLRLARQDMALLSGLADLSGEWTTARAAEALTGFADRAIDLALRAALQPLLASGRLTQSRVEDCGLVCLALGKLGAGELNYSSDADLIFFFDEQKVARHDGGDPVDLFVKVVRDFTSLLQERNEHGYVLRVDLRLRPDPNATPAVMSMAAAEHYYHSSALTWERAAFTRARVIAGDGDAGAAFLKRLEGWIWRRSMDFTAIRDIHDMRLHMAEHFGQEEWRADGFDLKRGQGGIREAEFMLQMHQLIHGGRLATLRQTRTSIGLAALAEAGIMRRGDAEAISAAYQQLRRIEHRLQMMEDAQTHIVPADEAERQALAALCGFRRVSSFVRHLQSCCNRISRRYQKLFDGGRSVSRNMPHEKQVLSQRLAKLGFGGSAFETLGRWRVGRYRALRTMRAQAALEALMPDLLPIIGKAAEPDFVLARLDDLLERLPSGVQFLELLETNPRLLNLFARILASSPPLATALARTPSLLDAVFDSSFFVPPASAALLRSELAAIVNHAAGDVRLDSIARWLAEKRFQIGVLLIDGLVDGRIAARMRSWIMDAVVDEVAAIAQQSIVRSHGSVKDQQFVILALGGWGGEALMPDSDLDMVCLFSGVHDSLSVGKNPLSAVQYFNRLTQRLTAYLEAQGPYGAMAAVDTRLRPSGNKGLLCVTIESFAAYERNDAWTWEHLALTRMRCVHGDGAAAIAAGRAALGKARSWSHIRADTVSMRHEIAQHKPPQGPFDIKLLPGGLIDLEFIVQACLLDEAQRHRDILGADIGTAISRLAESGRLDAQQAGALDDGYARLIAIRSLLSLCAQGDATQTLPAPIQPLLMRALRCKRITQISSRLLTIRCEVARVWAGIFNEERKIDDD
jgi:[glutamine synthetase] adenylyltransferase / [glutamine synthetase]-adenylyl-L-tyrosine phosphorylase